MNQISTIQPLKGLRVLSLAQQLPGPFAGKLLMELGAEVILIEQPNGGDPARRIPEFFSAYNKGKKSVVLDLKSDEGKEDFFKLARNARVILEGFRPGVAHRLGIDYESVKKHRQDIIYCSISGYGQDTEERLVPGHDISYQARAGGVPHHSGEYLHPAYATADLSSAMYAALAVASAAHRADSCYLDISMTEAVLSWRTPALVRAGLPKSGPRQRPGYGIYTTKDGAISLSITHEDHFWRAMCHVLGMGDVAEYDNARRSNEHGVLRQRIATALAEMLSHEALSLLTEAGVPAGPVNDDVSVVSDPMFRKRGVLREQNGHLDIRTPFSRTYESSYQDAPTLGEHTEAVLRELGAMDRNDAVSNVRSLPATP